MKKLFELEPAPCSDHDSPVLFPGWRELVVEVRYCDRCGEVVGIRLGGFDETDLDSRPWSTKTSGPSATCAGGGANGGSDYQSESSA
jgi:hypothetical protein